MVGVASFPGRVPAGRVVDDVPVMTVDFLPTVAAFAGTPLPADRNFDGVDLSPLLLAQSEPHLANVRSSMMNRTLFHPLGSGNGHSHAPNSTRQDHIADVPAMRFGRFKIFFATASSDGCYLANGSHRHGTA